MLAKSGENSCHRIVTKYREGIPRLFLVFINKYWDFVVTGLKSVLTLIQSDDEHRWITVKHLVLSTDFVV